MTKITTSCFFFLFHYHGKVNLLLRYCHLVWRSNNKGKDALGTSSGGAYGLKKAKWTPPEKLKMTKIMIFLVVVSASLLE